MADWTANSGWGATREPVFRTRREPQLHGEPARAEALRPEPRVRAEAPHSEPRAESLRAEPRAPSEDAAPRLRPGAAALAQYNAAINGPLAKARFAVWAGGGALSLLLIGGVGVWGYKLVLREVMGLPVVAAETGAMRVLPADPEGETVPSQGLAVNAIPAAGTAAPPSDVLVLAPQTPGLAEEDMEVVQTNAEAGEVMPAPVVSAVAADPLALVKAGEEPVAPPAEVAAAPLAPAPAAPVAVASVAAAQVAPVERAAPVEAASLAADAPMTLNEVMAMADRISAEAQAQAAAPVAAAPVAATPPVEAAALAPATVATLPAATPDAATLAEPVAVAAPVVALIPATVPGVASARRPAPRPATLGAAPAVAVAAVAAPTEAGPVPEAPVAEATTTASAVALTSDLPTGTNLVQLGAFDSPEIAAAEWERLQGRFGEFLGGRERVIQETQSNGRTFYRLRAMGFSDRSEARILCAALTAEDAACIPVTVD